VYVEQNIEKRKAFYRELEKKDPDTLIYLDESGIDGNEVPPRGYAPRGKRCYAHKAGKSGKRVSFIAALHGKTLFAPMTFEGNCDRSLFETWLEKILLPELKPGQTVILDNASWHKGGRIEAIITRAKCFLLYLAPYSPEDNPIEKVWSVIKNNIRKHMTYFYDLHQAVNYTFNQFMLK
jgi:transposase